MIHLSHTMRGLLLIMKHEQCTAFLWGQHSRNTTGSHRHTNTDSIYKYVFSRLRWYRLSNPDMSKTHCSSVESSNCLLPPDAQTTAWNRLWPRVSVCKWERFTQRSDLLEDYTPNIAEWYHSSLLIWMICNKNRSHIVLLCSINLRAPANVMITTWI